MADSKKYNGSTWEHSLRKFTTATDTFTTLPADVYADGTNATVGISGNTVQSGTPTPDSPIMPQGTGERTGNLFDKDNTVKNYYLKDGVPTQYNNGRYVLSDYIPIASDTATISAKITISSYYGAHWAVYDENKTFIRGGIAFDANGSGIKVKVVDTSGAAFIRVDYSVQYLTDCMVNLGSAPLPFEPYGYEIPILCGNQTINIYLGETQSTRQIKKLVLTGEEAIEIKSGNAKWYIPIADMKRPTNPSVIDWYCSHYQAVANVDTWTSYDYMISWSSADSDSLIGLRIRDINFLTGVTVDDFKSYLAAQYAAGTPVTVWYVLATKTTGIVNEPLRKIGDYADTVSGITIPTITGKGTFDIETTLKPSEVSLSYTGWRDATVKKWDDDITISDLEDITILQMQTYTITGLQGGNWI